MLGNIRPTNTRLISLSLKGVGEYLFFVDWQTVKLKFFVDWFVSMVQFSVYNYLKEDISDSLNSRTQAIYCHLSFDAYIKELLLRSVPIDALYIVRVNTHKMSKIRFPKCTQFLLHEIYLHIPCKINLRNNLWAWITILRKMYEWSFYKTVWCRWDTSFQIHNLISYIK